MSVSWMRQPAAPIDGDAAARARARQAQLTKPEGALGRLEDIAVRLAGMQGTERPRVDRVQVTVFAADHGVAVEAVSAYPRSVTRQMVANFAAGGAAVNVLAREFGAKLEIVDVGTLEGSTALGILESRSGAGTANLACAPAMRTEQLETALDAGRTAAERARAGGAELFVGGEMGIGNTTSAAALGAALLHLAPASLVGPGSGLDGTGVRRKVAVITRALALHGHALHDPMQALRRLGGFEIAALAGAFVACAREGIPLLIDGFITSVAALVASRVCRGAGDWMVFAHRSPEPGHARVLAALGTTPLLDLGMRLGEGSGALLALPILRLACALHASMATFEERALPAGTAEPGVARLVYLLRHGEPVGGLRYRGWTDDPLSAHGHGQMRRAIGGLGRVDAIVTSPLGRCADFARVVAAERGVPLIVEPGFRELLLRPLGRPDAVRVARKRSSLAPSLPG